MLMHSHDENSHGLEISSVTEVLVVKATSFNAGTLIKLPSFKPGSDGTCL